MSLLMSVSKFLSPLVKSLPSKRTSPLSGFNKPTRHFNSTLLPVPLAPIIKFVFPLQISLKYQKEPACH